MNVQKHFRAAQRAAAACALLALVVSFGAQAHGDGAPGVGHTPVTAQAPPGDAGKTLTAAEVELAPGAKAGPHHHAGVVFAYVLSGHVRSQLNGGAVVDSGAGQSWVEPAGTEHALTENASRTEPARLLAVFVAPSGATLTTPDK